MTYNHLGIPVQDERDWAGYLEGGKVHYSNPDADPFKIEWLKFEKDSPMPEVLKKQTHIAFMVDDLAAAMAGKEIVMKPFYPFEGKTLKCAFVLHNGALIELMEDKPAAKSCGCGCR
ncbi:MAG: VOC family protein [Thermoguttaceae bacterium]